MDWNDYKEGNFKTECVLYKNKFLFLFNRNLGLLIRIFLLIVIVEVAGIEKELKNFLL